MNGRRFIPAAVAVLLLGACADESGISAAQPGEITASPVVPVHASADLTDPEGSVLGTVVFTDKDSGVLVDVQVHGMTTGSHEVHLLADGSCEPGSTDPADPSHVGDGDRIGELPPIQVTDAGVGKLSSLVGSVDLEDLLAGDGTALVVGAGSSDPATGSGDGGAGDAAPETRSSVDAGSQTACGSISR